MQPDFDQEKGIVSTKVGYTGGQMERPTYEEVSTGKTGHVEAIEITFDPKLVSYAKLLDIFWRNIDPTMAMGQFADQGPQYQTIIFFHSPEQKMQAEESKRKQEASGKFSKPIQTLIRPAGRFYAAEEYHQKYYQKNPFRYKMYKAGSGREGFLKETWGDQEK
jgi:methionine-S-sulfoxide reductase